MGGEWMFEFKPLYRRDRKECKREEFPLEEYQQFLMDTILDSTITLFIITA